MDRYLTSVLYLITAVLAIFASAFRSHVGLLASYLLFASAILSFTPTRKWKLWLPVIGSAVLACYFIPVDIRNMIAYPQVVFGDHVSVVISFAFLGLLGVTLLVSVRHLLRLSAKAEKGGVE